MIAPHNKGRYSKESYNKTTNNMINYKILLTVIATGVAVPTSSLAQEATEKKTPPAAVNFGDFKSETLTTKAWEALNAKKYDAVIAYTNKCIDMYEKKALEMQSQLKEPAKGEQIHEHWALNDVATCYYIKAQSKMDKGDAKGAILDFKFITEKLSFGQCFDVNGWFWSPADAAKGKIKELEFDIAE